MIFAMHLCSSIKKKQKQDTNKERQINLFAILKTFVFFVPPPRSCCGLLSAKHRNAVSITLQEKLKIVKIENEKKET